MVSLAAHQKLRFVLLNKRFKRCLNEPTLCGSCALFLVNNEMWNEQSECVVLGNVSLYLCAPGEMEREGRGRTWSHRHFLRPCITTLGASPVREIFSRASRTHFQWRRITEANPWSCCGCAREAQRNRALLVLGKYCMTKSPCLQRLQFKAERANNDRTNTCQPPRQGDTI